MRQAEATAVRSQAAELWPPEPFCRLIVIEASGGRVDRLTDVRPQMRAPCRQNMRHAAMLRELISRHLRPSSRGGRLAVAGGLIGAAFVAGLIATTSGHGGHDGRGSALGSSVTRGTRGAAGGSAAPAVRATSASHGVPVDVSIDADHPGAAVPHDYLGLSFEAIALARISASAHGGN